MTNRPRIHIRLSIVLAGFLAYTSSAAADPVQVKVSELVAGQVALTVTAPAPGEWVLTIEGQPQANCKFNLPANEAKTVQLEDDTRCGKLFKVKPAALKGVKTTKAKFELLPNPPIPIVLEDIDELPGSPAVRAGQAPTEGRPRRKETVWYYQDGWKELDLAKLGDLPAPHLQVFVPMPDERKTMVMTFAEYQRRKLMEAEEQARKARGKAEEDCEEERKKRGGDEVNVLCFIYQGGWNRLPGGDTVMRPNKPLLVLAFTPSGTKVDVALVGQIGFAEPKVRDETTIAGLRAEEEGLRGTRREWPALKPGVHTLVLTVKNGDEDVVAKADIAVDEPYAGAIRIGVGAIFGGARDRGYAVQTAPGSGQGEIVATAGGTMDAELVLGVTAYLESGGRTYFTGERHHWAPYFGIGLLDEENSAFKLLRSLHLGVEYEISKQFSIAGTVVGRRVDRLIDGLEVGDPVTGTTVPTRKGYELGVGVVINVSPEFLKISKGKMSGFFK